MLGSMLTSEFSSRFFEYIGVTALELFQFNTSVGGCTADRLLFSLQYQNRKAEYFNAIWDVINWKTVEKRFQ